LKKEKDNFGGSSEFPPPPTPLCQSLEDLSGDLRDPSILSTNQGSFPDTQMTKNNFLSPNEDEDKSCSSSSSNESLPFANDKVGTIRQSASNSYQLNCLNGKTETSAPVQSVVNGSKSVNKSQTLEKIDSLAAALLSLKGKNPTCNGTSVLSSGNNNKIHLRRYAL